ncbi:MAG: peptidylprolyl isomerase [Actinobacteria bacterium]|nr:peptidylprolyl isomerase [Actinomycetota bacterium]
MPTSKRERQRANRQAGRAAAAAAKRRRSTRRNTVIIVVLVAVAATVAILATTSGKKAKTAKAVTTSATSCAHGPSQISFSHPPAMTIDSHASYLAVVKTNAGSFTITLDAAKAPVTVNNFVFLAQHGFYNCSDFQRVIPGFVVQGGATPAAPNRGPGYQYTGHVPPKAANPAQQYPLGSVAMANSGSPSSDASQFFIVVGAQGESLPNDYTLFGQVTTGMAVVQRIASQGGPGPNGTPKVLYHMITVTIHKT